MLERGFRVFDEFAAEVLFGGKRIVCRAAQSEIRGAVIAAQGKWFEVVKLEAMRLAATGSVRVEVGTTGAVALEDGATDGGGNVTPAPALVRRVMLVMPVLVMPVLVMLVERVRAFTARS